MHILNKYLQVTKLCYRYIKCLMWNPVNGSRADEVVTVAVGGLQLFILSLKYCTLLSLC